MDITVSKEELSKALNITQSIVDRKTTNPILVNLLLSVADGELRIAGTDLETTAVARCQAEVRSNGSTTVNASKFADYVRELPEGPVNILLSEGDRIELVSGNSHSKIIGVSSDEYPSLPGMGIETTAKINAGLLASMINSTLYAVSTDETRFSLNGVCFSVSKSGSEQVLKLVATDGHRLAIVSRPVKKLDFPESVIVPRKSLGEARKLLEEVGNLEIGVALKEGFFVLDTGKVKVSMRLVDGEFPDYKQVLPKDKGLTATVSSLELGQALKRVALLATDKNKCIKLDFSSGQLRLSTSSSELGEANETMDIDFQGDPLSVGFNARYVSDFIASLGEDKRMCIETHGVLGPGRFYPEGDESYFGIIMPMRLAN